MNNTTQSSFQTALSTFIARWQGMMNDYYRMNYSTLPIPTIAVMKGRKFARIVRQEGSGSQSSIGFVALVDGAVEGVAVKQGDILRSASWNAPAKHTRGSIFAPDGGMNAVTPYGVRGLR